MKTHLSEDTDDENCDDPIRLFDDDVNAIYLGSKLQGYDIETTEPRWTLEPIGDHEFAQAQNFTLVEPDDDDDLIDELQGDNTSECYISPLCVKLVDCAKFPWYFRKYTQQIMQKININEHSDSDHEIDVENIEDDSDDCFIVDNLEDDKKEMIENDENCLKTVKPIEPPPKVKKWQYNYMIRRNEKELQTALRQKNMCQVDFKRNQGLIGMKIKQKIVSNTTPNIITDRNNLVEKENAKQKCAIVDEKYLSAADKTLSSFGTELIPITDEDETKTIQCQINKEKHIGTKPALVKSSNPQNYTVQFEISKISEKLINDLKTKKASIQSTEDKIVNKVPNDSLKNNPEDHLSIVSEKQISSDLTITEKNTDSPTNVKSHVKNVKITNKYKNDQMKTNNISNNRSLIGLLVTNKSKENNPKAIKCTKQKRQADTQNITTKRDKKPRKKIKKQKYEPKSPILHCSTVPKKLKQGIPPKSNEEDISSNLPKEATEATKKVDKLSNSNNCSLMHEVNRLTNVIPTISTVTKPDVTDKQVLQNQPCIMQDKTISEVSNIHAKSLILSDKVPENCTEGNTIYFETKNFQNAPTISSSQNKTYEQTVMHEIPQDKVNENTINAVHDPNLNFKAPNKSYKPFVSNSNISSKTTIAPVNGSKHTLSNSYNLPSTTITPTSGSKPTFFKSNVSTTTPITSGSKPTFSNSNVSSTITTAPSESKPTLFNSNVSTATPIAPTCGSKPTFSNSKVSPTKTTAPSASKPTFYKSNVSTTTPITSGSKPTFSNNNVSLTITTEPSGSKLTLSNSNNSTATTITPTNGSKPTFSNRKVSPTKTTAPSGSKLTLSNSNISTPTTTAPKSGSKPTFSNSNVSSTITTAPSGTQPTLSNSNVATTATRAPTCRSKPTRFNQNANCPNYQGPYASTHNTLPTRMNNNNIPNNNTDVPIQNRYASAIILKSNNNSKFPFKKIREPPLQSSSQPHRPMAIPSHTQQRFRDPEPPYPIFYPPTPSRNNSEAYESYFTCPADSVPNQFYPSHGRITQQLSNPMQDFYRDCWLPQQLAPPPPPPLPPPPPPPPESPTTILPRQNWDTNKSKDCSNFNRPSTSVIQIPKSIYQNSVSAPQIKNNSSIIGMNNDGLVKKINIVATPFKTNFNTKKGTVNVAQITNAQIINLPEDTKIITTKTEMSRELDKLSFVDENINDFKETYRAKTNSENKIEKVAVMTKNPSKFETINLTMNKNDPRQTKPGGGYSPPILPIPTYQKVLDRVVASNSHTQNTIPKIALQCSGDPRPIVRNETKPMRKRDFVKCCKRKLNNAWNNDEEIRRREDAKKISLDEYKKRILKNNCKPEQNSNISKNKYNNSAKRPNIDFKIRENVDYGTETDLGYDSDSTVVL